jgi:2-hydroxycyclohexanecarboxyl-CoA dehydrogenase
VGAAFVTGGASGLGAAIVKRLAATGRPVIVADIADDAASAVAEGLRAEGREALSVHCDVADHGSVVDARETAAAEGLRVDMLVNNAGFDEPGFFVDTDPDRWGRLLAVDLVGVLNCTHVFAPDIAANSCDTGYGRIVNIASDAGRVGSMGQAVYSAAKGGVIAFSKTMARELARDGVTVNAICPGPADTPMTHGINEDPLGRKMMGGMLAVTPFKRLVTPDEVAAAVEFFGSEDARFITGQVLSVSGGLTMSG